MIKPRYFAADIQIKIDQNINWFVDDDVYRWNVYVNTHVAGKFYTRKEARIYAKKLREALKGIK